MNKFAVIMAGGGGTRFWPLSRQNAPKQLLNLSGNDIMINETLKRLGGVIDYQNMFIVTNQSQASALESLLIDNFNPRNILIEPAQKNTAPCILYAAMTIQQQFGDGIMCVLPSDHHIKDIVGFKKVIEEGIDLALNTSSLVTIGIKPTFPSTGYGYIKFDTKNPIKCAYKVEEFVEKPNYNMAVKYIEAGDYIWNSGMFIWTVSAIIEDFKRFLPRIYEKMESIFNSKETFKAKLSELYPLMQSISIDYGIMERSNNVCVIPGDFGWSDVGSWDSLGGVFPCDNEGNIVKAEHINIDTKDSIIYGNNKLIATVGVENMIIVNTDDALLVCPKKRAQDVKKIVDMLGEKNRRDLL